MIEAGKVLQNRYRVQKQIGQGGMGAVYVATDERFGSVVAIKETLILEENYRKAIEREARLLNSLKHPALPRVSDHFDDENGQFIVMEFVAGEDLSEMMEREGKAFSSEKVLNWADQLLDALEFLHTQEMPVIHRDIKPQNLKLTPRGQIILLDFGLAKGNPTDVSHQTTAKSIFGYSRNYASLEQIQGTGTDPRSDLYSLAATLYHLMTGTAPEDALTRAMYVLSGQKDTLKPANIVHTHIPRGVAAILQKAMDLNSNQRPATAKEMREMLREHEKYAHLIDDYTAEDTKNVIAAPLDTDVSARETQILPLATENQTDVKTQILPSDLSQATAVKINSEANTANFHTAENTQQNAPKSRGLAKFAAVAVLLAAVSAFAGVYLMKPEILGFRSGANNLTEPTNPVENNVESPKTLISTAEAANISNTANINTESVSANSNIQPETKMATAKTDAPPKPNEPAKPKETAKVSSESGQEASLEDLEKLGEMDFDNEEVKIKGDKIYVGNMVISNKGIVLPNGKILKDSSNSTPEKMKQLTPEQRRKLRIFRRNQQNQITPPPPVQPKTPPN